jgi:hypothetical protein
VAVDLRLYDVLLSRLTPAARAALDIYIRDKGYVFQDKIARSLVAHGVEQGRVETTRDALLAILDRRGLALTDAQRETIRGCTDLAMLEAWLLDAVTASSAAEVLAAP